MFVDHVSYSIVNKKDVSHFNVKKLKTNKVYRYSFYSSDDTNYVAHSYKFKIKPNKKYAIIEYAKYSSAKKTSMPKCIHIGLTEYLKLHRNNNYTIALAYINAAKDLFVVNEEEGLLESKINGQKMKNQAHGMKIVLYNVPVHNLCETLNKDILIGIFQYHGYKKCNETVKTLCEAYTKNTSKNYTEDDIDALVKYIENS